MTRDAAGSAPRLSISRFSAVTGLTPRTLRHYDALGLLRPAWVDGGSGYRYYRPEQLGDAELIQMMRQLGVPLRDVGALLSRRAGDGAGPWLDQLEDTLRREEKNALGKIERVRQLRALRDRIAKNVAFLRALVERLAQLPHETTLAWGEDTATVDRRFVVGWVGVLAPAVQTSEERSGRVWLIADPREALGSHHLPDLTIRVDPDLVIHSVWDGHSKGDAVTVALPAGQSLAPQQCAELDAAATATGSKIAVERAWSIEHIGRLVEGWIAARVGRDDITLDFDPAVVSSTLPAALERHRAEGFTDLSALARAIRAGRGDPQAGLAAMQRSHRPPDGR